MEGLKKAVLDGEVEPPGPPWRKRAVKGEGRLAGRVLIVAV